MLDVCKEPVITIWTEKKDSNVDQKDTEYRTKKLQSQNVMP